MADSPSRTNDPTIYDSQMIPDVLSPDAVFDALANQRRRYAIHCLSESQTPMALADLANEVATCEREMPITEIPAEAVKQVYISLSHSHIPKLADENIVEYTREQDLVTLSENSEWIESFVARATANE